MSLISHYKFEGNVLDAIGGSNAVAYSTSYVTGKIGQAASFSQSSGSRVDIPLFNPSGSFSISMWIYKTAVTPNDATTAMAPFGEWAWNATPALRQGFDLRCPVNSEQLSFIMESTNGTTVSEVSVVMGTLSLNTWYHIVGTYDRTSGSQKTYLNGAFVASGAHTAGNALVPVTSYSTARIGGGYTNAYEPWAGYVDDVKLYNHALSLKEVKELYKAKILHYKFDQLEEYTVNLYNNANTTLGGSSTLTALGSEGWYKLYLGNPGSGFRFYTDLASLVNAATYTGSVEVLNASASAITVALDWCDVSSNNYTIAPGERRIVSITSARATYDSTYRFLDVAGTAGSTINIRNVQIEQKDHATPYTNGTRADVITDSSGYANNGNLSSLVNTSPTWLATGNKAGLGCLKFTRANETRINSLTSNCTLGSSAPGSLSFWAKHTNAVDAILFSNQDASGSWIRFSGYSFVISNTETNTYNYPNGVVPDSTNWYHYVFVFSTTSVTTFINGVQQSTPLNYSVTPYNIIINRIGRYASTAYAFDGYLDDVRIYQSILTQADITELYQTRASIDNQGSLITQAITETGLAYRPSLIDYSTWILGQYQTNQSGFTLNGDGNYIITKKNPVGVEDIVWAAMNNDVASDADGGWATDGFTIDSTKKYRYSLWIRRENNQTGSFYFGCLANSVDTLGTTTLHNNPYFAYGTVPNLNEWFLLVAHIWPSSYALTASDPTTAIWNTAGVAVGAMAGNSGYAGDFKWHAGVTTGTHRAYLFYTTDPNSYQYFYRPRVDLCDGTEPTIKDLIACRENPILLTSLLPGTSLNWSYTGTITKDSQARFWKSSGNNIAWDAQAYTNIGYTSGAYLRFRVGMIGIFFMMGLNQDPTLNASFSSIDYAWYQANDTDNSICESGTTVVAVGHINFAVGDLLEIYYDNNNVYYYRNGGLVRTVSSIGAGKTFYIDSSFYSVTAAYEIYDIYFGPNNYNIQGIESSGNYVASEFSEVGPTQGLLAWYDFESATATIIPDIFGLNTATGYNTPTFTTMGGKRAITLNGSSQYLSFTDPLEVGAFSISVWINISNVTPAVTDPGIVGVYDAATAGNRKYLLAYRYAGGQKGIEFITVDGANTALGMYQTTWNPVVGTWYHIVAIYIPSTSMTTYINGAVDKTTSTSIPASLYPTTISATMGRTYSTSSHFFPGSIADVRIYDRALNSKEIATLYNLKPANMYIESNGIINTSYLIEG